MTKKEIFVKLLWATLLVVGVSFALRDYITDMLPADPDSIPLSAEATKAGENRNTVIVPMVDYSKDVPHILQQPPAQIVVAAEKPKDWTDYGDKIVAWLVALAGAYNLIKKTGTSPVRTEPPARE